MWENYYYPFPDNELARLPTLSFSLNYGSIKNFYGASSSLSNIFGFIASISSLNFVPVVPLFKETVEVLFPTSSLLVDVLHLR